MRTQRRTSLWVAATICFLVVGVPYWRIPYGSVNLPDALYGPGLYVVAGAALVLGTLRASGFWTVLLMTGLSVPAAVLARVVVEGVADPTSHNLWPFEVVIASGLGLFAAGIGTAAGTLAAMAVSTPARERAG
jgi:hypothetical protein